MKVKDFTPKYKIIELLLAKNEEVTEFTFELIKVNMLYIEYSEYEILSIKDYDDTKSTSLILKDY